MSNFPKEDFENIRKNDESQNIMKKLIKNEKHHKISIKEMILKDIDNNISSSNIIYYSTRGHFEGISFTTSNKLDSTKFNNKSFYSISKPNKFPTSNIIKINKGLNELNRYGSTKDLNLKYNNHSIFISRPKETQNKIIQNINFKNNSNKNNEEIKSSKKQTTILYKRRSEAEKNKHLTKFSTLANDSKNSHNGRTNNYNNYKISSITHRKFKNHKKEINSENKSDINKVSQTFNNKGNILTYVIKKKQDSRFRTDDNYSFNPKEEISFDNANMLNYRLKKNRQMDKRYRLLSVNNSSIGKNFFFVPFNYSNKNYEFSSNSNNLNKAKEKINKDNNNILRNSKSYYGLKTSSDLKNFNDSKINYKDRRGKKLNLMDNKTERKTFDLTKKNIIRIGTKIKKKEEKINRTNFRINNQNQSNINNDELKNILNKIIDKKESLNKDKEEIKDGYKVKIENNKEDNKSYYEEKNENSINEDEEQKEKEKKLIKNEELSPKKEENQVEIKDKEIEDIIIKDDYNNNSEKEKEKIEEEIDKGKENKNEEKNTKHKNTEDKENKSEIKKIVNNDYSAKEIEQESFSKTFEEKENKEGITDNKKNEKNFNKKGEKEENEDKKIEIQYNDKKENNDIINIKEENNKNKPVFQEKNEFPNIKDDGKEAILNIKNDENNDINIKNDDKSEKDNENQKIKEEKEQKENEKGKNLKKIKNEKNLQRKNEKIENDKNLKNGKKEEEKIGNKKEDDINKERDIKEIIDIKKEEKNTLKNLKEKVKEIQKYKINNVELKSNFIPDKLRTAKTKEINNYKSNDSSPNSQTKKVLKISLPNNKNLISNISDDKKEKNLKEIIYYYTSSSDMNENIRKQITNINDSYEYDNKYKYTEDNKQSINNSIAVNQLNNYNYLETKDIKNIKKNISITLHSGGNHFAHYNNIAYIESNSEDFKPYVSKYPEKIFKKRGMAFKHYKLRISSKKESKNKTIIFIKNKNSKDEKNKKIKESDKLKKNEDNKIFSSYFGDSNNNVYYEIKQFNESNKKINNIKKKEGSEKILNKRSVRSNLGNYNSFGVQSEALYIPKEI